MSSLTVVHDALCVAFGTWMLCSSFMRLKRCEFYVLTLTTVCVSETLALLASPWEDGPLPECQLPVLGVICGLFGLCNFFWAVIFMGLGMGASLTAFLWQLGPCGLQAEAWEFAALHVSFMVVGSVVFCVVVVYTPKFIWIIMPAQGALLVVVGAGGIWPEAGLGDRTSLFSSQCGTELQPTAVSMACVVAVAALSAALQVFVQRRTAQDDGTGLKSMAESLLPTGEGGASTGFNKCHQQNKSHLSTIAQAIDADEGADLSHLSPTERLTVMICRDDKEQRDRILWGGGLY